MQSIHNKFKHAIQSGQKQIGLWSHLCSPISIEILADCGYDWLLLDMEHSPNDLSEIMAQLQAMKGGSATPIVRPPWNDMVTFKRLLDIGVQNLLVPYLFCPAILVMVLAAFTIQVAVQNQIIGWQVFGQSPA